MTLKFKWHNFLTITSLLAIILNLIIQNNIPLLFIIVIGGIPLLLEIILKAFKGDLGADLLAAVALVTAVILEQYIASNLIILMLASGQSLEQYAGKKASFALNALAGRMPNIAHKKNDDEQIIDININDIKINDIIAIYPFETCPVDGVVIEGYGTMDESYLTGEPYQLSKAPGSLVLSGAINGENLLTIKAEKLPEDSRYAKIIQVMQFAETKRPKLRRLADQIGAIFAPFAFIFAGLVWYITGDVIRFLSVLVVATPCPLLIAIPITIVSAISIAARQGIIIKDPVILEKLPTCLTAIFDKTGTLTSGEPQLDKIITHPDFSEEEVLQLTASLEQYSRHPLSSATIKAAKEKKVAFLAVEQITEKPGQGLTGNIADKKITITSRKKVIQSYPDQLLLFPDTHSGLECVVLINNRIAALLIFRDQPRLEGKSFINHLAPTHHFKKIMLVSGDRESEVRYLADLFGIKNIYFSQSPEQKLQIVRDETAKAPTLFMGDGINDAPALAVATVGLAFGKHNVVTAEAAKAVIMENSLAKVDELIHISEDMRKIALQSAIGGMILSVAGMIFAAGGFITPISGAILQEVIDLLAILNALRLTWQKDINSDIK